MAFLRSANLLLAFVLELCALAAFGYWGYRTGTGRLAQLGLAIGAPLLVAVLWGMFAAPRATLPLPEPWRLLFKIVVFGLAVTALAQTGSPQLALGFALAVAVNLILLYL